MFSIDADIRRAETLPAEFYTEDEIFALSHEKIFARSWQLAATIDEIDNLKPHTILEEFLDEPVLLTRDSDEKLRCISNVCTHRGKVLIKERCRAENIRCGYHGRRFDLAGKFISMPEFEGVENFPTEKDDLVEISSGAWRDFVFVSIDPIVPLGKFVREMDLITERFDFGGLELTATRDYQVRAHWALYCENYLEGFHIPYVHQSLNRELDYGEYRTELFRFSSLQIGKDKARSAESGEQKTGMFAEAAALYFFIFPNLMFNFYPWGISVNIVKPLKKDLTRISYLTYVNNESRLGTGAGADLDRVEREDQQVVESVQTGIGSRFYRTGRYSPARERGTHHFHRLIAEFMKR